MEKENFMPKGLSEVKLGRDWSVIEIIAIYDDKKVPFKVINGELEKLPTRHIRFNKMNRQVRAVARDAEKRAKLARQFKKPNWAFDLERYGIVIEKNGYLKISRWITKKDGTRKRIWQTVKDINAAIRMQNYILKEYLEKKSGLKNGSEILPEFSNLFKKLSVVQPYIEMRRLLLIHAQEQMDISIRRTIKGINLLLGAKGRNSRKCHGVPRKLKRLAFFLNNNWSRPYRKMIDQILSLIKEAEKSADRWQWDKVKSLLSNAENILTSVIETSGRQRPFISISEIDPIRILAEVDRYGLTDEIMVIAKKFLTEPPYYYEKFGLFRLSAMLAVSQLVITGKTINREEILKLCR